MFPIIIQGAGLRNDSRLFRQEEWIKWVAVGGEARKICSNLENRSSIRGFAAKVINYYVFIYERLEG